jgi:hypothetical protein
MVEREVVPIPARRLHARVRWLGYRAFSTRHCIDLVFERR